MKTNTKQVSLKKLMMSAVLGLSLVNTACSKSATFSLMSDQANFQQNSSETNGKIDVLFVVDNSGSMKSSQDNLAASFSHFIELFTEKGFDYQIAVTTSDAYRSQFVTDPVTAAAFAKYKDGIAPNKTGVFIIKPDPSATDAAAEKVRIETLFKKNIIQGINGNGDERVFSSFEASLTHAINSPANIGGTFPRADAFLSVIVISDEEDFSQTTAGSNESYTNPNLIPVNHYVDFLDGLKFATPDNRSSRYNVNNISIIDQACLTKIGGNAQKIGKRYIELTQLTNGISGSLCEDFGPILAEISHKIVELVTQFYLDRIPQDSTLQIFVNGVNVPRLSSGDPQPWNGFLYHPETNSVTFHGTSVPPQGAQISVKFDPKTIK